MSLRMFPAKIENLRRNPVCLQRYRHVVARKRQHGLTTTLIYATTPLLALHTGQSLHLVVDSAA
ncbi:hypothetical protein [Ralstonia pseudosolanacearum]|uniref:hypothetical protein n=1 Tax=Ralstonia pseudosolanacearum TaxID=1310165 RepID=UPI001FFBB7BA|nr:hypothetical protein [Ralstonia pseudosolanacearum]